MQRKSVKHHRKKKEPGAHLATKPALALLENLTEGCCGIE
jgi:hypothetical protein